MTARFFLMVLIVCLVTAGFSQTNQVVIKNVAVIDMKTGMIKEKQNVSIEGNRIVSVGSNPALSKTATIIDGTGKYLIPGLWDMHIHCLSDNRYEWVFPLLIANGVTGVREMGNNLSFEKINQIRRSTLDGNMIGPRIGATTARILEGPGPTSLVIADVFTRVDSVERGRRLVREYKQQGMDFIKPYNLLSREVYLAIIDEAKKQKIPVEGHVPFSMTAAEVSDLGQLTIEHLYDIPVSCSADEANLRKELDVLPDTAPVAIRQPIQLKGLPTFDENKAKDLFKRFAHNGTWMCPTAIVFLAGTKEEAQNFQDERLKYIPVPLQEQWRARIPQRTAFVQDIEQRKMRFKKRAEITTLMYCTGVGMLAGSDAANPYVFPGFGLHDELELFVQAGLSPLEALQTATINAAKFLHKEKEMGAVAKGMYADLVLLDANPLENISNVKKISAVIANGRLFQRADLDKLLAAAKTAAKN